MSGPKHSTRGTSLHGISGADGYATTHLYLSSGHVPCSQPLILVGIMKMAYTDVTKCVSRSYSRTFGVLIWMCPKIRKLCKQFYAWIFGKWNQRSNSKHHARHLSGFSTVRSLDSQVIPPIKTNPFKCFLMFKYVELSCSNVQTRFRRCSTPFRVDHIVYICLLVG